MGDEIKKLEGAISAVRKALDPASNAPAPDSAAKGSEETKSGKSGEDAFAQNAQQGRNWKEFVFKYTTLGILRDWSRELVKIAECLGDYVGKKYVEETEPSYLKPAIGDVARSIKK